MPAIEAFQRQQTPSSVQASLAMLYVNLIFQLGNCRVEDFLAAMGDAARRHVELKNHIRRQLSLTDEQELAFLCGYIDIVREDKQAMPFAEYVELVQQQLQQQSAARTSDAMVAEMDQVFDASLETPPFDPSPTGDVPQPGPMIQPNVGFVPLGHSTMVSPNEVPPGYMPPSTTGPAPPPTFSPPAAGASPMPQQASQPPQQQAAPVALGVPADPSQYDWIEPGLPVTYAAETISIPCTVMSRTDSHVNLRADDGSEFCSVAIRYVKERVDKAITVQCKLPKSRLAQILGDLALPAPIDGKQPGEVLHTLIETRTTLPNGMPAVMACDVINSGGGFGIEASPGPVVYLRLEDADQNPLAVAPYSRTLQNMTIDCESRQYTVVFEETAVEPGKKKAAPRKKKAKEGDASAEVTPAVAAPAETPPVDQSAETPTS